MTIVNGPPEQAVIQAAKVLLSEACEYCGVDAPPGHALEPFNEGTEGWQVAMHLAHRLAHRKPASEGLREAAREARVLLKAASGLMNEKIGLGPDWGMTTVAKLTAALQPLTEPQRLGQEGEAEDAAWTWMEVRFGNVEAGLAPQDRDYSADEMVDAFIAGIEVRRLDLSRATPDASRVMSELEDDAYGPGGPSSGKRKPGGR